MGPSILIGVSSIAWAVIATSAQSKVIRLRRRAGRGADSAGYKKVSGCGAVAIAAANLVKQHGLGPPEAWRRAVAATFAGPSYQKMGSPKGAFLGLCEEGLVVGVPAVPPGTYTKSRKNKGYAVAAVNILQRTATPSSLHPDALWLDVLGGVWIKANGQMDVVLGLWNAGLIRR